MFAPHKILYMGGCADVLLDVRDAVNRRRDPDPDPARLAEETGHPESEVLAALEALEVDGEVLT